MEQLEAGILGTVYRNPENGYSVVSVRSGRNEFTVVGTLPELAPGEQAVFSGEWIEHRQYGRQFRCSSCALQAPTTRLGIERYLGSGFIRGIGPVTAKKIVDRFGEETLTVLSEHPERLQEIPGFGKKRWIMVAESFREQQSTRQAMVFLQSYGIPAALSIRISKLYGENTQSVVRADPYRLCDDLEGVGFRTADRIGIALGIAPESEPRICCALKYLLREAASSMGHVYLPEDDLCREASHLLGVPADLCGHALAALALSREIICVASDRGNRCYLPAFFRAEKEVALRLHELRCAIRPARFSGGAAAVSQFEAKHGIVFSDRQRDAVIRSVENGVFVITGGPGTGKTTIINCILELLRASGSEVMLCAPTGRAAKRMTEATGAESRTVHRMLEYGGEDGSFARNAENPIEADCIIVDEASMIDLMLMKALLRAIDPGTRLIIVGDADQLPSVGPGNVLGDILESGCIPAARLTDIYRQSEQSRIVVNAHRINRGDMPLLNEKDTDFFFERKESAGEAAKAVVSLVSRRLPAYMKCVGDELRSIQVLAPAKKGDCGVIALNTMLQGVLNPPSAARPQLLWNDTVFRLGDKVIQTRNDYSLSWRRETAAGWTEGEGIFNGDMGFITEVDPEEQTLTVRFDDDRDAVYELSGLEDLELAYCLSVHKSQGSEFPAVVMPVVGGPAMLLTRNLFYTALTRAKQLVVLVGRKDVIRAMTENDHEQKRYTSLTECLRDTAALGGVPE